MKSKTSQRIVFVVTLIALILFMIPFYLLVLNSFKSTAEFIKSPFAWPSSFSL